MNTNTVDTEAIEASIQMEMNELAELLKMVACGDIETAYEQVLDIKNRVEGLRAEIFTAGMKLYAAKN